MDSLRWRRGLTSRVDDVDSGVGGGGGVVNASSVHRELHWSGHVVLYNSNGLLGLVHMLRRNSIRRR